MHGLLGAYPDWRVHDRGADDDGARLAATVDVAADPVLLAAFPFPHTLTIAATVRDATLHITTTLRATGTVAVPVAFGFHPYLSLPDVARADWQIAVPVRRRARSMRAASRRGRPSPARSPTARSAIAPSTISTPSSTRRRASSSPAADAE